MASADVETGRVPDVIKGRHRSQKEPQTQRRYSRKTSEDSATAAAGVASPRSNNLLPAEQRRRSRPEGIRSLVHRRQQAALRRSSESALLPPIRVSALRQVGPSSPTHDANDTSSPTSNVTLPVGIGEEDDDLPTTSTLLVPLSDPEARSPTNRRETQSMLSLAETTDTPRLSPIASADHLRLKAERRITKSVNDTLNDVTTPKSPSATLAAESTAPAPPPPPPKPSVRGKSNRRISMQSLPKLSPNEEPFSVRRKIEQFRKWHEEQYAEKLKKLKVEADKERREASNHPPDHTPAAAPAEMDFAKLLEENMKNFQKADTKKTPRKDSDKPSLVISNPKPSSEKPSPAKQTGVRCKSGASWRTWRDVNDSYAYDDVEKYIEQNELMPPDRVKWISEWLGEVEAAFSGDVDDLAEQDNVSMDLRGFP